MSRTTLSTRLPKPMAYRLRNGEHYYWLTADDKWSRFGEKSLRRQLIGASKGSPKKAGGALSQVDQHLALIDTQNLVDYAGPVAGYPAGVLVFNGAKILVTEGPKLVQPSPGEWLRLNELLTGMLGGEDTTQLFSFFAWMKVADATIRRAHFQPGQALVLAGPKDSCKSLLQALITVILGGRAAKPARYISGATDFNRELVRAEHWLIEDELVATTPRERAHLAARIKELTVNECFSAHGKGDDALVLQPIRRLTISINETADALSNLPPFDDGIGDKIMLLRVRKPDIALPGSVDERVAFLAALVAELPAFVAYLQGWEIPEALRDKRFGVQSFHHPELLADLRQTSPEYRLFELICRELDCQQEGCMEVSSTSLEMRLAEKYPALMRTLCTTAPMSTLLARLEVLHPTLVRKTRTASARLWQLSRPVVTR
ncbi:MAG: hypothetical protein RL514_3464 [Verrucomicrobiota bacterium]|jgi:hypothetical protein